MSRWAASALAGALVLVVAIGLLFLVVPRGDDGIDWTGQLIDGGWMAWTLPVALFFLAIAALLGVMTLLAVRYPETPRVGILRTETTRGDRLFVTLLGSAFINLAWLYAFGADGLPLWWALLVCLAYAVAVFRWV